jgi:hypothetical protein
MSHASRRCIHSIHIQAMLMRAVSEASYVRGHVLCLLVFAACSATAVISDRQ